jgi:signal transduction histidine kinase
MPDAENNRSTYFAPAKRTTDSQVQELISRIIDEPIVHTVLKAIDGFVVLLNPERQILKANDAVLELLGLDATECVGRRPGEAFDCIHHVEGPGGCGTSRHCARCGAVLAILASQKRQQPVDDECLMTRRVGNRLEAVEFRVRSTPLVINGNEITAFVLHDISTSKRKEALERVFLHDLMNILGGLLGYIELWEVDSDKGLDDFGPNISRLVKRLSAEIQNHRILFDAERGDLTVHPQTTSPQAILTSLQTIIEGHEIARERRIDFKPVTHQNLVVKTDPALLLRVLINMLKNALEASPPNSEVSVWFETKDGQPCFCVHNQGVISDDVALQVFQRSFTTKHGKGRGLGTYSMKLIGETYLKGRVDFSSNSSGGTCFHITLPN